MFNVIFHMAYYFHQCLHTFWNNGVAISLAIGFLSCNNHLQPICNSMYFYEWVLSDKLHKLQHQMQIIVCEIMYICNSCNSISTMKEQLSCNSNATNLQLPWQHHSNVTWHYGGLWMIYFLILISTIHYDHSFIMVLDCDTWGGQKLPCGILIEFWKLK